MGFGAIAGIDSLITAMMCFVLYKNRRDIGIHHLSRHSGRLLLNLITYALATGLITTWVYLFCIFRRLIADVPWVMNRLTAILGLILVSCRGSDAM